MGGNDAERVCLRCPSSWHHFGCPDQHCTLLGSDYDFNSWLPLPVAIATTSFVSHTLHTVKTCWKDTESQRLSSKVKAFISDTFCSRLTHRLWCVLVDFVQLVCGLVFCDSSQLFVCCRRWSGLIDWAGHESSFMILIL